MMKMNKKKGKEKRIEGKGVKLNVEIDKIISEVNTRQETDEQKKVGNNPEEKIPTHTLHSKIQFLCFYTLKPTSSIHLQFPLLHDND
jgi:hypothetical protein